MVRTRILLFSCLLSLTATCSSAATFRYLSVDELTRRSDACVVAEVLDSRVGWNEAGNIIVTTYTLELKETLSGETGGTLMTLTRVGGEVDGLALGHPGMPSLETGETALLFVLERDRESYIVSGLHQGVFHERNGHFERDLSDVQDAPQALEQRTLGELRATVRHASLEDTAEAGSRR